MERTLLAVARLLYSWRRCRSWDSSTAVKLPRWSELHHLIATVGKCAVNAPSTAAAGLCVMACTWPHWSPPDTIPSYTLFICDCQLPVNQPSLLSLPP